jgi:hypothetical protein
MDRTEESSGVWFWVFLIILIFVLYCLVLKRPYCQTLDLQKTDRAIPCAWEKPHGRPVR